MNVSPTAGTVVTATQGAVVRPLPFTPFTVFPTFFRSLDPFDPSLTGTWSITAANGPDSAGPILTNAILNAQLVPLAQNLALVGGGATPTLTWTLPDLTGFDVESTRIFVYDDANDDVVFNPLLAGTPTQYAIPGGVLLPGVPYVFAVILNDDESFGTESRSVSIHATGIPRPRTRHGRASRCGAGWPGCGAEPIASEPGGGMNQDFLRAADVGDDFGDEQPGMLVPLRVEGAGRLGTSRCDSSRAARCSSVA